MLKAHDVPGAAVAFAERGSVSWVVGQGVAERSTGRAVTAETPFEAASLSKPAFACAVLRLCSLGALSLETEVGDVLGDEDLPSDAGIRRVRVKQILTHTSGIPPDPPKGRMLKLASAPGSRFAYSPHAFDYLQRMAVKVSSRPLAVLMEDLVLKPSGMRASWFDWSDGFAAARAVGYDVKGTPGRRSTSGFGG